MNHGFSVSFSPIGGSWPILVLAVAGGDGADALGLFAAAQGHDRPMALVCALRFGCWRSCSACWRRCGRR